jgi:hypothetical protein
MLPSPLSSSTPPNPEPEVETPHFEQEDDLHHDVDVPESEEYTSGSEDDADFDVPFPSSDANIRPIKKVRVPKPRGVRGGNKWRSKMGKDEEERERTRQPWCVCLYNLCLFSYFKHVC